MPSAAGPRRAAVAHRTRAVIAIVVPVGVPAAPLVGPVGDRVGGGDRGVDGGRRIGRSDRRPSIGRECRGTHRLCRAGHGRALDELAQGARIAATYPAVDGATAASLEAPDVTRGAAAVTTVDVGAQADAGQPTLQDTNVVPVRPLPQRTVPESGVCVGWDSSDGACREHGGERARARPRSGRWHRSPLFRLRLRG
jgi:hypothetical protein